MPSKTALAKLSYAELLEVRKNVDEAITHRHNNERQELTKQLTNLARLFGAKTGTPAVKSAPAPRVSTSKGKKVKPKYRNPSKRSETWTGRGRQPLWLVHELSKGKNIESFLIR